MTDPLSLQKQLASQLNARFETLDDINLADHATLEPKTLQDSAGGKKIPMESIVAFDELQKRLQSTAPEPENKTAKSTPQPMIIAGLMFVLAAIIVAGEYIL